MSPTPLVSLNHFTRPVSLMRGSMGQRAGRARPFSTRSCALSRQPPAARIRPMSRRARATALIALAYWPAALAQSWTDPTRARMIKDALKISPPALNQVLQHYEKELLRGMLDPSRHETEEVHYQLADGKGGLAAAGIERKTRDIIDMLSKQASFGSVTYEMGVLAHLVS